ncbi:Acetyl-CoA C-acyltransferase [Plasmodiophora brassicae]|uniref:Acetyl-CoA C-acyltransferase n=1 Tax=Plasmodiophora brassicae TaxID=37360 RepID=A0A0G4IS67_PLABS|nr:hypothetical protein PBRA_006065 [Plasmodiophora brassicae]SPQ98165.1 unnamed protein product [Plasmodiophora brassicae]
MDRVSRLLGQASAPAPDPPGNSGRTKAVAVVVGGCRTPFVKSFGSLQEVDATALGVACVRGLIEKYKIDPVIVDDVIWGNVVVNTSAPNIAREIVIDAKLPRSIPGVTVSRACLSGLQAIEQAVTLIESGYAHVVIAGGSDSTSNGEMPVPRHLTRALGKYALGGGKKAGWSGVRTLLSEAGSPSSWVPKQNEIAERSTGRTMGYHSDLMAEIRGVSRTEQDEFAKSSHAKASSAQKAGYLAEEIVPVPTSQGKLVDKDDIIRESIDVKKLASLSPAFRSEKEHGTVTAASASALTDGASAVLIMSATKAKELGFPTDVTVAGFATSAVDPYPELLIAPAIALPRALQHANLSLKDIDIFEIHEAFAAQVLATLRALASDKFAKEFLGRDSAVGTIPADKINPCGGSVAIGHPFAATGGRLVISATNQLRRTGKRYALLSICAAGGIGGVAILEHKRE